MSHDRRRALRQLAREEPGAYSGLVGQVLADVPGLTHDAASGRALTMLGRKFPDRYQDLRTRGAEASAREADGGPPQAVPGHGHRQAPSHARQGAIPGALGFTPLELVIMRAAWDAGGWLSAGEICKLLEPGRPVAEGTLRAVADALARKGHLDRSSRDGADCYRPARTLADHIAALVGALLDASPDPAATLALVGHRAAGVRAARIAVCYDGWWFQDMAGYFAWQRGAQLSMAGLHDALRWHAAGLLGRPVQRVTVSHAHFIAGRDHRFTSQYDREMASLGVIRHDMPVTRAKGEVGADVELALTCYQLAADEAPDMIVLLSGDGDFAPLADRLARLGTRVLVPAVDLCYPRSGDQAQVSVRTSARLARDATDTPALAGLLAAADDEGYPQFLARPFPAPAGTGQPGRRSGTVVGWEPGRDFGFITDDDDGSSWFATARETHAHARLSPGTQVTFTGDPLPLPGKSRPRALDIRAVQ